MINGDKDPPGGAAVAFVMNVEKTMGYVLEEITPEDREKIFKDVGELTARMMIRRGGLDEEEMRLFKKSRAVDREKNIYLMTAQNIGDLSDISYYFFFEGGGCPEFCVNGA